MTRRFQVVLGGMPLLLAALLFVRPAAFGEGDVVNLYNAATAASALALTIGVLRWRPAPLWPWLSIAAAIALWSLGDVVYSALGTTPTVSIADAFYLAGYLGLIGGVARIVRARTEHVDVDGLIDAAMILAVSVFAVWDLVVEPTWRDLDVDRAGRIVVAAYPVLDAVILTLIGQLLLRRGRPPMSLILLATGMFVVLAADVAYAVLQQSDSFAESTVVDASWPLGYALIALGAVHQSVTMAGRASSAGDHRLLHTAGLLPSGLALITIPVVTATAHDLDHQTEAEPLLLISAIVVLLTTLRLWRLHRNAEAAAAAIARSEDYFRALAQNSSDAYVVIDEAGGVVQASAALEAVTGRSPGSTIGQAALVIAHDMVHPADLDLARAFLAAVQGARDPAPRVVEVRLIHPDGSARWVEARAKNLLDNDAVRGIVVNVHDIDGRKRAEADLVHQAFHDALTGLPNRVLLRDRVAHACARRTRSGEQVAVVLCDLDGFKSVNDTLGHDSGDELLRVAARRLQAATRRGDTVARLGGDEFGVLLEGHGVVDRAETVAQRMLQALSDPIELAGTPLVVTGSIGIALAGDTSPSSADDLLRRADIAMYQAKATGRNRAALYDDDLGAAAVDRLSLSHDLHRAIERGELVLQYQPIIALDTHALTGFEALVRWQHPERGLVPPAEFIPTAEESGSILDVGRWVLRRACATAAHWPVPAGSPPLTIAVNVSARQLETDDIVADVLDALTSARLDASRLTVEITETSFVTHPDAVIARLGELKRLGVRIAIDDFGTGYSSLAYLKQFPVDVLKIDRSFVDTISDATGVPAIVRGLLDLGRVLELEMVAEGIERHDQAAALAREGCPMGQGYLFSVPLDESDADHLAGSPERAPEGARSSLQQ